MVHVLKDYFLKFTNRGGLGEPWTKQVLTRTNIKMTVNSRCATSVLELMSPWERKRYADNPLLFRNFQPCPEPPDT